MIGFKDIKGTLPALISITNITNKTFLLADIRGNKVMITNALQKNMKEIYPGDTVKFYSSLIGFENVGSYFKMFSQLTYIQKEDINSEITINIEYRFDYPIDSIYPIKVQAISNNSTNHISLKRKDSRNFKLVITPIMKNSL